MILQTAFGMAWGTPTQKPETANQRENTHCELPYFLSTTDPAVGMRIISVIAHILSPSRCGSFPVDYALVIILSGWVYVSHSAVSDSLRPSGL